METEIDIHGRRKRYKQALASLWACSKVSKHNKKLIEKFARDCLAEGLSYLRASKYIGTLKQISLILKKDLELANKEDIKELMYEVEQRYGSEWSIRDVKVCLKKFYKWLRNTEECPPEVKWLSLKLRLHRQKAPEDMLTEEDVAKMINATNHPRDACIISMLWESGMRIGELGTLRIGSIKFDENGTLVKVTGKTGFRFVRLVSSSPYLSSWINIHPYRSNPKAALFINTGPKNIRETMNYANLARVVKTIGKAAGISKPVNPHHFRHSRASYLCTRITESTLKQFMGWAQGSDQVSTYLHLNGKSIDNEILAVNGVEFEKEVKVPLLKPKVCNVCGKENAATFERCSNCGHPLNLEEALKLDELSKKVGDKQFLVGLFNAVKGLEKEMAEIREKVA